MLLLGLALAGCETGVDYTKWRAIKDHDSLIEFYPSDEWEGSPVSRQARKNSIQQHEYWDWKDGALFLANLFPGSRFSHTFDTPGELRDASGRWKVLKQLGFTIKDDNVKYAVGGLGQLAYSVSHLSGKGQICFVFSQALRDGDEEENESAVGTSGGYVTGYHCAKGDGSKKKAFTGDFLKKLEQLKLQQ